MAFTRPLDFLPAFVTLRAALPLWPLLVCLGFGTLISFSLADFMYSLRISTFSSCVDFLRRSTGMPRICASPGFRPAACTSATLKPRPSRASEVRKTIGDMKRDIRVTCSSSASACGRLGRRTSSAPSCARRR